MPLNPQRESFQTDNGLPGLIRAHVGSVWSLEMLLLLWRTAPQSWHPEKLSAELRGSVPMAAAALAKFERSGLVSRNDLDLYTYKPAEPLLDAFVQRLALEYKARPVAIINLIAAPEDRIQALADAFIFKRSER